MLSDLKRLRNERGSILVTALLVMAAMIPIGFALLAIVDTQARQSGQERTRDRAFNLADSALAQRRRQPRPRTLPSSGAWSVEDGGSRSVERSRCAQGAPSTSNERISPRIRRGS